MAKTTPTLNHQNQQAYAYYPLTSENQNLTPYWLTKPSQHYLALLIDHIAAVKLILFYAPHRPKTRDWEWLAEYFLEKAQVALFHLLQALLLS